MNNGMVGKYVIVRCRDAGVHAGVLEAHQGRECILAEARRLWRWRAEGGGVSLSEVAVYGIAEDSKITVPVPRIHLTENCEIILTSAEAEASIRGAKNHVV
jgi:hypothetical protein